MYSKVKEKPPPVVSFIGKHYINNPAGETICRCGHCRKLFKWVGWEWREI